MTPYVKNEIFSYEELKEKAKREIQRLQDAENKLEDYVMDYALNAAFSVYHLLEWREKTNNPDSKRKAHELCAETANEGLKLLHSIVTCNKHVTVGKPFSDKDYIDAAVSAKVTHLVTEGGDFLITESGDRLITEDSKVVVKFDNRRAIDVLNEAIREFA